MAERPRDEDERDLLGEAAPPPFTEDADFRLSVGAKADAFLSLLVATALVPLVGMAALAACWRPGTAPAQPTVRSMFVQLSEAGSSARRIVAVLTGRGRGRDVEWVA